MSDSYSIQEVGGAELAQRFPDRGVISDSDYHNAVLVAGEPATGWRRLFTKRERFLAVLSANKEGLRVLVLLDKFVVFIPWSEIAVSAERSLPGTNVRLQIAAVPSVTLEFHLDDDAADALFAPVISPLARRDPPGRLYWPKPWAVKLLLAFMLVATTAVALLRFAWPAQIAAVVILSVVILFVSHFCRPIFEEDR
jgi:hypothetical protein